jgi:hypothetical protein
MTIATKKILRNILAASLCLTLLSGAAACGGQGGTAPDTPTAPPASAAPSEPAASVPPAEPAASDADRAERWNSSLDATYNEEEPDDSVSIEQEPGIMRVGRTADGKNIFALSRFALGATWLADELTDARLFLKAAGETRPERLRLCLIGGTWNGFFSSLAEIKALLDEESVMTVDVTNESDDWISVPITEYVKTWLKGDLYNNGLAIFGETENETYAFSAVAGGDDETIQPYIAARGAVGDRALIYGKYGYTEMPVPGELDNGGNCMSYSLRDINMILADDLGLDESEMARVYKAAAAVDGVDAVAEYTTERVLSYVEAHKEGLALSQFRRLDSFDSEIDAATEYRIALRVGVSFIDDIVDFSDDNSFDYHFWAQLNDGRWAQKFPTGPSEIVPCTGPGIAPDKYLWDSTYVRTPKSADYYTSKVIYFAATKDTDEFTRHRGEMEDRF